MTHTSVSVDMASLKEAVGSDYRQHTLVALLRKHYNPFLQCHGYVTLGHLRILSYTTKRTIARYRNCTDEDEWYSSSHPCLVLTELYIYHHKICKEYNSIHMGIS